MDGSLPSGAPGLVTPDEFTEDAALIAQTGERHEQAVLKEFHSSGAKVVEIPSSDSGVASTETLAAIRAGAPVIYQAALESGPFSGFADFLIFDLARALSGVGYEARPARPGRTMPFSSAVIPTCSPP